MSLSNNWFVITGGPSSGKSTTLDHLEKQGHIVVPEAARVYIDQQLAEGKTLAEIRASEENFQKKVLQMKQVAESKLLPHQTVFLDRGMHDNLAYMRLYNYPIDQALHRILMDSRYKAVFLLEMLDFEDDYARTENLKTAQRLEALLAEVYTEYQLPVIRIPRAPIEERVQLILNAIH